MKTFNRKSLLMTSDRKAVTGVVDLNSGDSWGEISIKNLGFKLTRDIFIELDITV